MAEIDFDAPGPRLEDLTIRDSWRGYLEAAVPKGAGPEQIQATRDAFYAGFLMCHSIIQMLGKPDLSVAARVDLLKRLTEEGARYAEQVMRRAGGNHG